MTLWGDFAEIEGQMLQSLESDKPVLAFCDVNSSIYQGDFVLSTTPVSSLLINPQFEKANNLQEWNDNMKAQKIDLSLMPSRLMQTASQVKNTNILNGSLAIVKDMYYKFNATISGIDNSTDPWYHACKKCYMKVTIIKSSATCTYCRAEDIDYEERYRLKIDVTAEDQFLRITLFDAAKYYFSCDVKDYVLSTSEKIDRNFPNVETNMNVIAMEIHEVPKKFAADQTKVKTPIKKQRCKRMKKLSDNKKMKEIAADIPHVEKDIAAVETDTESPEKTNRCKRTKKIKEVTAEENPQKVRIHKVEKQNVPDESDDETPLI
ncbi:replication protein A 70 kDa DNA-binding subunit A-like [Solanum verrucosum]|uniref:replication protein A 70 kDa DNA-binding subunit A-like n=1 Tax=Solanum verrucosum TaxID=315347 RepID=UPI0020D1C5EE|nr:replication protein A 70 kDa DNA-binding subunit A-like [Solanum verrucosum]